MKQKWKTVKIHRSYEIQINELPDPLSPNGFGYRIKDPAFLPDYARYKTIEQAVMEIDKRTE
jgi:hypothetical protein